MLLNIERNTFTSNSRIEKRNSVSDSTHSISNSTTEVDFTNFNTSNNISNHQSTNISPSTIIEKDLSNWEHIDFTKIQINFLQQLINAAARNRNNNSDTLDSSKSQKSQNLPDEINNGDS